MYSPATKSGGEGAGLEVVGVEAEVGGQLLGAVFAAVGGGVEGVGKGQTVGIVLGALVHGPGRGVDYADDVALVVGDVGVIDVIGGDVALGSLVAVEFVICEQVGAEVVAAAQGVRLIDMSMVACHMQLRVVTVKIVK